MLSRLKTLACLLCFLALPAGPQAVAAATWQEQRDAGIRAFNDADYAAAAERLAAALTPARDAQASPEELGAILERLTTAYFAIRLFSRAQDSIAEWDVILAASADEPWAAQQRSQRDVLAVLVAEVLGQSEPETPVEASPPVVPPPEPAAPSQGATATPDPEADTPFEPDQQFLMPQAESPAPAAGTAAGTAAEMADATPYAPPATGRTAIHLVSLTDPEGAAASWEILQDTYPEVLADKDLEVRLVELEDQGTVYRLYAVPFSDAATAGLACEALERTQQYCAVVPLD